MHSTMITGPAERGSGLPLPFPPSLDEHDDEGAPRDADVPPAAAEPAKSFLDRLLEAICKPGEGNYDNP